MQLLTTFYVPGTNKLETSPVLIQAIKQQSKLDHSCQYERTVRGPVWGSSCHQHYRALWVRIKDSVYSELSDIFFFFPHTIFGSNELGDILILPSSWNQLSVCIEIWCWVFFLLFVVVVVWIQISSEHLPCDCMGRSWGIAVNNRRPALICLHFGGEGWTGNRWTSNRDCVKKG